MVVVGELLEHGASVRAMSSGRRTGHPAERPLPSQNSGRMYSGMKRYGEGVLDARLLRLGAEVVAVVERDRARRFSSSMART